MLPGLGLGYKQSIVIDPQLPGPYRLVCPFDIYLDYLPVRVLTLSGSDDLVR
jgi:hypothetical protein